MKQVSITRRARFNAAHKLWNDNWDEAKNFEVFGKCAHPNWHGHNYVVYVTVKGAIDEDTGYFINFTDLKAVINEYVEEPLDHRNLNIDVPWLKGKQTSVENLVIGIWEQLEPKISERGCTLERVRLFETENNYADYYGEA
jgi:6-pyruvoyltetrahydropterin/6-carboxytetrahydropterin synthase